MRKERTCCASKASSRLRSANKTFASF
jgi:hypothetical protein